MDVEFEEIRYMKTPPDEAALREIIAKLEDPVENLVRKDAQFAKLGLSEQDYVGDADAVVGVLLEHPKHMQRPVIVTDKKAIIGRPLGDTKAKDRLADLLS